MSKSIQLNALSADDFKRCDTFFHSDAAKQIAQDYYDYVWTSAMQYIDTGDVQVLNRIMMASRIMHRVRLTSRMVEVFAAHKPNKSGKFSGKMHGKTMQRNRDDIDRVKTILERIINDDAETKAQKAQSPFDLDKGMARFSKLVSQLVENGATEVQLRAVLANVSTDTAPVATIEPSAH